MFPFHDQPGQYVSPHRVRECEVMDEPFEHQSMRWKYAHNVEPKIPGQIRSVLNVQEATAKALLVDRDALVTAERDGDVLAGNAVLMDAFATDVRADLAAWRTERGLPADPMGAYRRSGWAERIVAERVGGDQAGWGA